MGLEFLKQTGLFENFICGVAGFDGSVDCDVPLRYWVPPDLGASLAVANNGATGICQDFTNVFAEPGYQLKRGFGTQAISCAKM